MCVCLHIVTHMIAGHCNGRIYQIANDLFHIAAHISDFGELRGLDLEERRACQFREAAADLGFAHTGGADHQDVLWIDLFTQFVG